MTMSVLILQMPYATTAAPAPAPATTMRTPSTISSSPSPSHEIHESELSHDISSRSVSTSSNTKNNILQKRTRLRKRHSEYLYLQHHLEESNTNLEWVNTCNGFFEPSSDDSNSVALPSSYFLGRLRNVLSREFHEINGTMREINITDLSAWSKYKEFYGFLPRIQLNSKIALKRWYRHMQIYIATFAHLGRMQYKFDRSRRLAVSDLTRELNGLLMSARSILCEIETTINGSYPFPSNQRKLYSFTREEMNKRIQFLTNARAAGHHRSRMPLEPLMIDLQFSKFRYFHFLRRIWRVLRLRMKHRGQQKHGSHKRVSLESTDLSASTLEENISANINELNMSASVSASESRSRSNSIEFSVESRRRTGKKSKRNRHNNSKPRKSAELPTNWNLS